MRADITHVSRRVLTVRSADRNDGSAYTPWLPSVPERAVTNAVGTTTEVPVGDARDREQAVLRYDTSHIHICRSVRIVGTPRNAEVR